MRIGYKRKGNEERCMDHPFFFFFYFLCRQRSCHICACENKKVATAKSGDLFPKYEHPTKHCSLRIWLGEEWRGVVFQGIVLARVTSALESRHFTRVTIDRSLTCPFVVWWQSPFVTSGEARIIAFTASSQLPLPTLSFCISRTFDLFPFHLLTSLTLVCL